MAINKDEVLTVEKAAGMLGLDERTVRLYCKNGRLPAVQYGRAWLIDRKDLWRFAKKPRPRGNPNFVKSRKAS